MNAVSALIRELKFVLRRPFTVALFASAALLSTCAIWNGLASVAQQNAVIEQLVVADGEERQLVIAKQTDFGGAAYYSFHFTYAPPSNVAFAAMGVRDIFPWKHRIRMLALEGQIYETDSSNAELAQAGRFDFAFIISIIAPLFLIVLLHDQRAAEVSAGRHDLLVASVGNERHLWLARTTVRLGLLCAALLVPFLGGAAIAGSSAGEVLMVCLVVFGQVLVWTLICLWASRRPYPGPSIASGLVTLWIITTFLIPSAGDALIKKMISVPPGGDIILSQREAVNDAWDLPKSSTMEPFVARHPEWAKYAHIERPFEWKWYYAFQQVGDQSVENLSELRRRAITKRDSAAVWVACLSPSSLVARTLSKIANTDTNAAMAYEQSVREFHAALRGFYYPLLFTEAEYSEDAFDKLPFYVPKS